MDGRYYLIMTKSATVQDCEYPNQVPRDITVSVCMITYNHAAFIAQAIESVLMQKTDFPIELCIGEDDSSDGTREICLEYARKYPTIIRLFLRNEIDKTYIDGRKTGVSNFKETRASCSGRYVALLEGDDFWIDGNKLQREYEFMERNPQWTICASRCVHWCEGGRSEIFPRFSLGNFASYINLLKVSVHPHTSTYFYRNQYEFPGYLDAIIQADLAILLHLGKISGGIPIMTAVTSVYRINSNGILSGESLRARRTVFLSFWKTYAAYAEGNALTLDAQIAKRHIRYLKFFNKYDGYGGVFGKMGRHFISLFIFKEHFFSNVRGYLRKKII